MKVVYIAGPITADNAWERELNIRRAEKLCIDVYNAGAMFICPHTMCRFIDDVLDYEKILEADFELIKRCDAILLVEGWEKSQGTLREIKFAKSNNIPIFHSLLYLSGWLNGISAEKNG